MARVIIDLPDSFMFSTEVPIYIGHINHGHHLDNAALLMLVSAFTGHAHARALYRHV